MSDNEWIERAERRGIRVSKHDSHDGVTLILADGKREIPWQDFRRLVEDVEQKGKGVIIADDR